MVVLFWSGRNQKKNAPAKAHYEQVIDSARAAADDAQAIISEPAAISQQDSLSPLFPALNGEEEITVLDNGLVRIGITSKGAAPCFAQLSSYNDQEGREVTLFGKDEISLNFKIDGKNQNIQSKELFFETVKKDAASVTMRLNTNGYGYVAKNCHVCNAMSFLNPRCWIVNSWTDGHPRKATFEGVSGLLPGMDIFITNSCSAMQAYANFTQVKGRDGHIVVRVNKGGGKYLVYTLSDSDGAKRIRQVSGPYSSR